MIFFARPWLFVLLLALPWWWWRRKHLAVRATPVSETAPFAAAARGKWRLLIPPALRSLVWVALVEIRLVGPNKHRLYLEGQIGASEIREANEPSVASARGSAAL